MSKLYVVIENGAVEDTFTSQDDAIECAAENPGYRTIVEHELDLNALVPGASNGIGDGSVFGAPSAKTQAAAMTLANVKFGDDEQAYPVRTKVSLDTGKHIGWIDQLDASGEKFHALGINGNSQIAFNGHVGGHTYESREAAAEALLKRNVRKTD